MHKASSVRYLIAEPVQDNYDVAEKEIEERETLVQIDYMRQIGPTSLLIKWNVVTSGPTVDGYDVCVDGELKMRVFSGTRRSCVVDTLKPDCENEISLYAVSNSCGRHEPPATACFAMSSSFCELDLLCEE